MIELEEMDHVFWGTGCKLGEDGEGDVMFYWGGY